MEGERERLYIIRELGDIIDRFVVLIIKTGTEVMQPTIIQYIYHNNDNEDTINIIEVQMANRPLQFCHW